jgi:hypothetical protein
MSENPEDSCDRRRCRRLQLARRCLDEAGSAVRASLAVNSNFSIFRARILWTARSDDPTYLAGLQPVFEGMRKAGMPER